MMPCRLLLTLLLTLTGALITPLMVAAHQEDPCRGLEVYETQLLEASAPFSAWLIETRFAERDLLTLSAPELRTYAEHADALQTALMLITPPAGVAGWHQLQIEVAGYQSSLARSAASIGMLAALLGMQAQTEEIEARRDAERDQAIATCPAFAETYRQWETQDQPPGTPVAA